MIFDYVYLYTGFSSYVEKFNERFVKIMNIKFLNTSLGLEMFVTSEFSHPCLPILKNIQKLRIQCFKDKLKLSDFFLLIFNHMPNLKKLNIPLYFDH